MTPIEKMREWIKTYPGYAQQLNGFYVDYTDQIPGNMGISPAGLVEVSREVDILGYTTVVNLYNFGLYCVLPKAHGDDEEAKINADWIMDFQEWVQRQSVLHYAPTFGDCPKRESMVAQNGILYETSEEGTATYMVQLSAKFEKHLR